MRMPWKELNDAEVEALRQRQSSKLSRTTIPPLRRVLTRRRQDPVAEGRGCVTGFFAYFRTR